MVPPNVVLFDDEPDPYFFDGKHCARSSPGEDVQIRQDGAWVMVVMRPTPDVVATICVCSLQRLVVSLRCDRNGLNQVSGRHLSE